MYKRWFNINAEHFIQKLVSSPDVKKEDFKQTLQQAMKEKGLDTKLRNTVFHWVRTQSKQNVSALYNTLFSSYSSCKEKKFVNLIPTINIIFQKLDPLTSLLKASAQWEKRIHKSLNSMCSDLETSLAKIRSQTEQEELTEKWNELSTYNLGTYVNKPCIS